FIVTFCNAGFGYSQSDSILVVFEFSDDTFKESIQNVNATFTFSSKSKYRTSNSKGKIEIYVPNNSLISYKFNHAIYESVSGVKKVFLKELTDTFTVSIEMVASKINSLKEIVIKAPGVPDTVFESKRLSVADFEVQQNGRLVLLTYPKQLRKGSELLLYDGMEVLNTFSVPGIAQELVRDYRGNAHVVCDDNVYGLHVNGQNIEISSLEKAYYLKYLAPILDTNRNKMFFSNFNKDYPAFEYYSFDQLDSTYSKIINIKDDLMMELYKSEYKWVDVRTKLWAKAKENETGIEAEIWVGANYFTQSIYYKELYAPLFSKNDTVYVFDYYRDKLYSFDRVGNPLDSVAIYHHYQPKSTGWKKQLIQDKGTGEIYAVYDRSGYSYIGLIDPKTGEIKEQVRLEFRYVDKISVHDNFVYYVYRPFETAQKKFLYKERLPYNFGFAKVPYGTETSIETGK
ncbi:MAG: hypothetical protein RI883_2402, partial [Bacteroidota bacterium]